MNAGLHFNSRYVLILDEFVTQTSVKITEIPRIIHDLTYLKIYDDRSNVLRPPSCLRLSRQLIRYTDTDTIPDTHADTIERRNACQ